MKKLLKSPYWSFSDYVVLAGASVLMSLGLMYMHYDTSKFLQSRALEYKFTPTGKVEFFFERETPHGAVFGRSLTEVRGPYGTCRHESGLHTYEQRPIGDPARYTEYDETAECIVAGKTFIYDVRRQVLWNDWVWLRSAHDIWTCKNGTCEKQ